MGSEHEDGLITPDLAAALIQAAFPGGDVVKGAGIGRRITFNVEFGGYHLSIYTPEGANMKKNTTVVFRHPTGRDKQSLAVDDAEGLVRAIKHARARVMGVYFALKSVLEPPEPERANLFED